MECRLRLPLNSRRLATAPVTDRVYLGCDRVPGVSRRPRHVQSRLISPVPPGGPPPMRCSEGETRTLNLAVNSRLLCH
jgi:hypothetical protein